MEASCLRLPSAAFGSNSVKHHRTQMRSWHAYTHLASNRFSMKSIWINDFGECNRNSKFDKKMTVACSYDNDEHSGNDLTNDDIKKEIMDARSNEALTVDTKRTAKIHDFCLGIPFGAIVVSGGLVGYLFSRNTATLGTGLLFGAPLLLLSCVSLRVWRQGQSSLPFILGQGALAAALFWKHFQSYSSTKRFFFPGLNALFSVGMLCFYSYVLLAGGNPPPKAKRAAFKST